MKLEDPFTGNKIILVFRAKQEIAGEPIVFEELPRTQTLQLSQFFGFDALSRR